MWGPGFFRAFIAAYCAIELAHNRALARFSIPSFSSFIPTWIVCLDIFVALLTIDIPPIPKKLASEAHHKRLLLSFKCGDISLTGVRSAKKKAALKSGIIGIKVSIMPPDIKLPDKIKILEEPVIEEGEVEEKKEKPKKKANKSKTEEKVKEAPKKEEVKQEKLKEKKEEWK